MPPRSRRDDVSMTPRRIIVGLCLSCAFAFAAAPAGAQIPFEADETSGPLKLVVRHRVEWTRRTGRLSWDRLEAELPGRVRVSVDPGWIDPTLPEATTISLQVDFIDGRLRADSQLRIDRTWASTIEIALDPRNVAWKDPPVRATGIALDMTIEVDSRIVKDPLRTLRTFELRSLRIDSIQAGPYRVEAIEARGGWRRPNWRIDRFSARGFGGQLEISGEGFWGTDAPPRVSLLVRSDGVDLHALLAAFNIPRADEIAGRLEGRVRVEIEGRRLIRLDVDAGAAEGTLFLSRELLFDILAPQFGESLTREEVDRVLADSFGDAAMIPFDRSALSGSLTEESLALDLRMENRPINLRIEPVVERALLWDTWDALLKAGIENVTGARVETPPPPP